MENGKLIDQFAYMDNETTPHKHHHLFSELIYVKEGLAVFTIDGKEYTGKKGSLFFVNSYEPHEIRIQDKPYHRYFLTVNPARLERLMGNRLLASVFKNRTAAFTHCVDLSSVHEKVSMLLEWMLEEFQRGERLTETVLCNYLENLLVYTYRACPTNFIQFDNSASGRVAEVQQYIERHFTEELRISDLAEKYYVSPTYLSHVFKSQVGYSPKQYILLNRLSYSKELLETTDLQINHITYKSGFGDVNNFIRAFREWFGVSPGSYRAKYADLQDKQKDGH